MYVYLPDPLIKMVCVQVIAPQKPQKTIKTGFFFQLRKKYTETVRALTLEWQKYSHFSKALSRIHCSSLLELIQ